MWNTRAVFDVKLGQILKSSEIPDKNDILSKYTQYILEKKLK